jgi:lipopolysaccharide export LptBFGC system permease protein LptF
MAEVKINPAPLNQKFKRRFLLIPIGILVATVIGFSALKTSERQSPSTTETKTTATVEFDKAVPPPPPPTGAVQNKSSSSSRASVGTYGKGTHVQISLDVLKERENFKAQQQRWYAQMAFSGIMALASLYVILSKKYPDEVNKFGYSTIAFIMGFWLKGM